MTEDRWHASRPTHGPDPHTSDTVGDEHDEWVVAMLDALDDEQTDAVLDAPSRSRGSKPSSRWCVVCARALLPSPFLR